jgi:predicted transcriptional regulator
MAESARRINVTLDSVYAAKLSRLAERTHVNEGTLARSLLSQALDEADPDARDVAALLDGLPGASERAQQGLEDAKAGRTVALDDL